MSSPPMSSPHVVTPQEMTVEKLCDDVLVEIFSYLSAKELKSAALVCKQWDEVIGSSAVTMKKFKVEIGSPIFDETSSSGSQLVECFKKFYLEINSTQPGSIGLTRKHQNIRAVDLGLGLGIAIEHSEHFELSHAKFFKFDEVNDFSDFLRLLSLTPLLEELHICYRDASSTQGQKMDLPRLKKIFVESNDAAIYDLITCNNLVKLDHQPKSIKEPETNQQSLVDLLGRCNKLKSLRLGSQVLAAFLEVCNPQSTGWQLSTFKMYFNRSPDDAFVINLEKFLISQANTLEILQFEKFIDQSIILPTEFYKKVFSDATKLAKFRNSCDREFFENHGESLRSLSALEELEVDARVHDLDSIARFNPKLIFLVVESVTNQLDSGLKFNNLKQLGVAFLGGADADAWLSLIANCPKIETFEFKYYSNHVGKVIIKGYVIKALLDHPTIRHLKFYSDNVRQLVTVFMKIARNYGNLARLTLRKMDDQPSSIEFSFPEDPTLWNFVEQSQRFKRFIRMQ